MSAATTAGRIVVAGLMAAAAALLAAPAQPNARAADPLLPKDRNDVSVGYASCAVCHAQALPIKPGVNAFAKQFKSHEFVRLNEGETWLTEDPHSTAYAALVGPRGNAMAKALKYNVTKAPQCLSCHATDTNPGAAGANEKDAARRYSTSEGVTCAACHGIRLKWQVDHYRSVAGAIPWRTLSPAEKEKAGMRNLRDPVVAARLCASCHVGEPTEGKVLTHEMYTAGHPPLPPFELVTFMEDQPRHWNLPTDPALKFFTDAEFAAYAGADFVRNNPNWPWELYRFHPADKEVYLTRHVVAGAAAALAAEQSLLRAFAEGAQQDGDGIDFAAFDCFTCHHDLRRPPPARGGTPGRPPLKRDYGDVAVALMEPAGKLVPAADVVRDLRAKWDALDRAGQAKPFGDVTKLAPAADDVAKLCDKFLTEFARAGRPVWTAEKTRDLLVATRGVIDTRAGGSDPVRAAQLTWAYLALRARADGKRLPADRLRGLGAITPLRVRDVPHSRADGPNQGTPVPAGERLGERMDLFNAFDAEKFGKAFRAVASDEQPK